MSEIWGYGKNEKGIGEYKVYTEDPTIKERIKRIKDCQLSNTYYFNGLVVGWDIIFPKDLKGQVEALSRA